MKDNIRMIAGIGVLLIALALIVTPVAAANLPWKMSPAAKYAYNSHTLPDRSSIINSPNFRPIYGITKPVITDDSRWDPVEPSANTDYGWRVFGTNATLGQDYSFTLW